jgi:hypothetical protein
MEVNSKEYWDYRFGSGDWSEKGGFSQTSAFAASQVDRFGLAEEFAGTLCDFGCGAGDAFPVYRAAFPHAKLIGIDFSNSAVELARQRFAPIAEFYCGGVDVVPETDVIVCSNVLEHLPNDEETLAALLSKCRTAFVVVPYRESPLTDEHVRAYGEGSFARFSPSRLEVFKSPGWTEYGIRSLTSIYVGNVLRLAAGRPLRRRKMQVIFEFRGSLDSPSR